MMMTIIVKPLSIARLARRRVGVLLWLTAGLIGLGATGIVLAETNLLEPDAAFRLTVKQKDSKTLLAEFEIAKDYYLYKDRIRFVLKNSPVMSIQSIRFPAGDIKQDTNFGRMEIFKKTVAMEITLQRIGTNAKMDLIANYQGCEEKRGVCYAPIEKSVALTLR